MSEDINAKYQQHYNKILSGTLSDTILKSISFQANINLANEIIAEQEKTIADLESELEQIKKDKATSDNTRITNLELNNKTKDETIQRLNSEIATVHKIKGEYESLKAQVNNAEMFRNQLVKERESHEKTKSLVEELKQRIEILEAPPKKKKTVKSAPIVEEPVLIVQQPVSEETAVRDGGSF